jgi:hypothetical protein
MKFQPTALLADSLRGAPEAKFNEGSKKESEINRENERAAPSRDSPGGDRSAHTQFSGIPMP